MNESVDASGQRVAPEQKDALGPVTVSREFRVKKGHEAEFESSMKALMDKALTYPGHLGVTIIRPTGGSDLYRFVYRFDTGEHMVAWHSSEERAELMNAVSPHISEDRFETTDVLALWVDPSLPPTAPAPPKWKLVSVTWFGIFPTVVVVSYLLKAVNFEAPIPVRGFVLSGLVVPIAGYFVIPPLQKLLHGWLHANK